MAEHSTPVVSGSEVGIIANPMSGRDIRRVVAQASVFPNTEKTSMVLRIIRAVGALGVERVLLSTDAFGIAAGVLREVRRLRAAPPSARVRLPEIEFLTLPRSTGSATDTTEYARIVAQRCSAAVVVLGGDGTMRAAARGLGDTPMLALSTGTNNAFPIMIEATVAGMALGLIATGRAHAADPAGEGPARRRRPGRWHTPPRDRPGRRVRQHRSVRSARERSGRRTRFASCTAPLPNRTRSGCRPSPGGSCRPAVPHRTVSPSCSALAVARRAPCSRLSRRDCWSRSGSTPVSPCTPGVTRHVGLARGTVALDGERELEFGPGDRIGVTLAADGPRVIDVPAVLASECSCCSTVFMNSIAEEIQ